MEDDIAAACAVNGGFILAGELVRLGVNRTFLERLLSPGALVRVRPGAYAPGDVFRTLSHVDQHRIRIRAVVAKLGDRVAVSHRSASVLHGHDQWGWDQSIVDVTRLDGGACRTEAGVRHHVGRLAASDLTEVDGLVTVVESRAVVESCVALPVEAALCSVDSALRLGRVERNELLDLADAFGPWPKSRSGRLALRLARPGAANPGESRSRYLFWRFAIPEPVLQYPVVDEDGVLVGISDFAWLDARHLGEFDGRRKYERDLRAGEEPADAVFREKRREDALRACVFGMSRLTWADLAPSRRARKASEFAGGIADSQRLYGRGRVHIA